jgi:hypothetical protein
MTRHQGTPEPARDPADLPAAPDPADRTDVLGGPDQSGYESELGGPDPGGRTDDLGGPDESGYESELGGPDPGGRTDDLGGPDPDRTEDELRTPPATGGHPELRIPRHQRTPRGAASLVTTRHPVSGGIAGGPVLAVFSGAAAGRAALRSGAGRRRRTGPR